MLEEAFASFLPSSLQLSRLYVFFLIFFVFFFGAKFTDILNALVSFVVYCESFVISCFFLRGKGGSLNMKSPPSVVHE
jgi:hypothetical protein